MTLCSADACNSRKERRWVQVHFQERCRKPLPSASLHNMSSGSLQSLQQRLAPAGLPSRIQEHRSQGSSRAASLRTPHHTAGSSTSLNRSNSSNQARVFLEATNAQPTEARSSNSTQSVEQEALPSLAQAARLQAAQPPYVPGQARRAMEAMLINPLPLCHSLSNISTASSASLVVSPNHSNAPAELLTTDAAPSGAASFLPFSLFTQGQTPSGQINEFDTPTGVPAPHDAAPAQAAEPGLPSSSCNAAEANRMLAPEQRRHIDDWLRGAQAVEHRHGPEGPRQNLADLMNMLPPPNKHHAQDPAMLAGVLRPDPYRPFANNGGLPLDPAQRRLAENQLPGANDQQTVHGPANNADQERGAGWPIPDRPRPAQPPAPINGEELLAFVRGLQSGRAQAAPHGANQQHGPAGEPAHVAHPHPAGVLSPLERLRQQAQAEPRREPPARNRRFNADELVRHTL